MALSVGVGEDGVGDEHLARRRCGRGRRQAAPRRSRRRGTRRSRCRSRRGRRHRRRRRRRAGGRPPRGSCCGPATSSASSVSVPGVTRRTTSRRTTDLPPRFRASAGSSICSQTATRWPSGDQLLQVLVGGVDRHAAHRDVGALVLAALGERDAERARGDLGVVEEQLVEIAHPVEQQAVRIGRLDLDVLRHHRRRRRRAPSACRSGERVSMAANLADRPAPATTPRPAHNLAAQRSDGPYALPPDSRARRSRSRHR